MGTIQHVGRVSYQSHTPPRTQSQPFTLPLMPSSMAAAVCAVRATGMQNLLGLQEAQSGAGSMAVPARYGPRVETDSVAGAATKAGPHTGGEFIAAEYDKYIGHSAGSGQCVALVQAAAPGIGLTRTWAAGEAVQGNTSLQTGTAIATFEGSGRYANAMDGSSHAAIYLGQDERGMQVLDQWAGSAAAVRTIPWSNPSGVAANTGSAFRVVRPA